MFVTVDYQEKLLANKIDVKGIWKQILCYSISQFPNLTLLAQIIITLSGSNSAVERSFSILTAVMTDRRLKLKHDTINMTLRIYSNDKLWSQEERDEIIKRAVDIQRKKKKKMDEIAPKKQRVFIEDSEIQKTKKSWKDQMMMMKKFDFSVIFFHSFFAKYILPSY